MILDDIVRDKRADLEHTKAAVSLAALQQRPPFRDGRRNFAAALAARRRAIIAEVKKASPSKGVIRSDFDPVAIARRYAEAGAAALSVLTEARYFQGHLDYLAAIRAVVDLPLLRKDFLFDPYQLWLADELNLSALVEVHDRAELDRAVGCGARLLGINNRDLRTFHTTLETTERLVPAVPSGALVIAESGIERVADIERLERAGVSAFLIGEAFMRVPDPGARLAEFLGSQAAAR
jgi:indole-3-glycerol phosphate synthase